MKKLRLVFLLLIPMFFLAGCNLPGNVEPTVDIVTTQVAKLLTEAPTITLQSLGDPVAPTNTQTNPSPENTSTSTATATATVTVTPTETQNPNDPAQQLGSPAWTEDFNGSSSPWDFDSHQATFQVKNGALNLSANADPNWHSWYVSSPKLKNAYIEATIQMPNCSGLDRVGLAVRSSSDGQEFYFLGITCDGQWGFFRMEPGVNIKKISDYTAADPLNTGTNLSHRVGIWMSGTTFTIYIDGKQVGSASDSKLTSAGFTGFLIAHSNTPGFTVLVEKLAYWNVP